MSPTHDGAWNVSTTLRDDLAVRLMRAVASNKGVRTESSIVRDAIRLWLDREDGPAAGEGAPRAEDNSHPEGLGGGILPPPDAR